MSAKASRSSLVKAGSRPRPRATGAPSHSASKARAPAEVDPASFDDEREEDPEDAEVEVLDDVDPKSQLKDDPILDRRIIEGMLHDRKALLEELAKEGMTQAQVLRRAAELGLSEALLRQVKGVAADLAGERPGRRPMPSSLGARTCLSCDRVFLSTGPGNRLCMRCRGGDAGLAQF